MELSSVELSLVKFRIVFGKDFSEKWKKIKFKIRRIPPHPDPWSPFRRNPESSGSAPPEVGKPLSRKRERRPVTATRDRGPPSLRQAWRVLTHVEPCQYIHHEKGKERNGDHSLDPRNRVVHQRLDGQISAGQAEVEACQQDASLD
jgi:hypothetical protein